MKRAVEKKLNDFRRLPLFSRNELSQLDWILASLLLLFLYVSFMEGDIVVTGNRSFLYYKDFLGDFYKASYEQSGGFYANYLPPTFLAFAIWNLPLYIAGRLPASILTTALVNLLWYKLLPVIIFFVTSHQLYKLGLKLGFEEKKSKLLQFAFLVCPICVYSQFIFSQYDIFMIFFMMLGLNAYFKDRLYRFALFFGLAATFKYQALAYFAVLLVLRVKKYSHLLLTGLAALLPLAITILPYRNSPYFYRCVLGFHALSFTGNGFTFGFVSSISPMLALAAYLMVWAYIRKITAKDEFTAWALFLCNGVSFTIFGFSRWNPQWFIVMVPFLLLALFLNRHGKPLMLLQILFIIALYIFSVNQWKGIADQVMVRHGIWKFMLEGKSFAVSMADIYPYRNMTNLATCIFSILLVFFIFNHPKYLSLRRGEILPYMINYIRIPFLAGILGFILPLTVCMASAVKGNMIFVDSSQVESKECGTVNLVKGADIQQTLVADGSKIRKIWIRVGEHNRINDSSILASLADKRSGRILGKSTVSTLHMVKEESMYLIWDQEVKVEKGREYILKLTGSHDPGNCVAAYYCDLEGDNPEIAVINGNKAKVQLIMKVSGLE